MKQRSNARRKRQPQKVQRLADLSLTDQDYCALRRRGTVCSEWRRGKVYFRLRFRDEDGRQRSRYLGRDSVVAETIRRELESLQLHRQHQADLRRCDSEARSLLRQIKQDLAEVIEPLGLHWHGFVLRRCSRRGKSHEPDNDTAA